MARIKLSAAMAFEAAKELAQEGDEVNSSTLWMRCGGIGSITTAKKWAELWQAFEEGEQVDKKLEQYRPVYDAVKEGEEADAAGGEYAEEEPIPQVVGATQEYARQLSAIVRELVEEKTGELAEVSSALVEKAQQKQGQAAHQVAASKEELREAQKKIASLEADNQQLHNDLQTRQGQIQELEKQLKDTQQRHITIEEHNRELSKQLGEAEERVATLEREGEASKQELNTLNAERERLGSQLVSVQELAQEREVSISSLERDKAIASSRAGDLEKQVTREQHHAEALETRNQELSERLTQEAAKAASAFERARQLEVQVAKFEQEGLMAKEGETKSRRKVPQERKK
ncbi:MAG: hypothetical protein F6J86_09180 [Symploca sp. SIO1B1]|nr:hypothetical protein [Symploca sp. SIO1B1]